MEVLDIETLKDTLLNISPVQCDGYSEGCIVALEAQGKQTGVKLKVTGDAESEYLLNWKKKVNKNGWKEPIKFTESGAVAISFFLTRKLTEFNVIEEALIGTGVDYWLGYDDTHPNFDKLNFINARVEISGILEEKGTNTLEARVRKKMVQTEQSDSTKLPAYVSIIEISTPKDYFAKK
jgi:hypothetical protein